MASNILNFSTSRLITGINVIDGMLFWVDNETEPHKINIEKFKGNFEGVDVDHSSGTTQIYNRPFELRDITVLKEHPTESIQTAHTTVAMIDPIDIIVDDDGDGDDGGGGSPKGIKSKKLVVVTNDSYNPSIVQVQFSGHITNSKNLTEGGFYWSHTNSTYDTIRAGLSASPPTSFKIVTNTNVISRDYYNSIPLYASIQSVDSSSSNKDYNANLTTGALSYFAFGKEEGIPKEDFGRIINLHVKTNPSNQNSGTTTDFTTTGSYSSALTGAIVLNGKYTTAITVSTQGFYVSKPYVNSDYGAPTVQEIIDQANNNTDPDNNFPGKHLSYNLLGNKSGTPLTSFSSTLRNVKGGYTYYYVGYLVDRNGTQYSDGHVLAGTVKNKIITDSQKAKAAVFNLSGSPKSGGAILKGEIYNTGFTGATISDFGFYFSTVISDPYDLVDEFSQGVNADGTPSKTGAAANTFKFSSNDTLTRDRGEFTFDTTLAVQNLAPGTTIYYVAFATNPGGEALGTNFVSQLSYVSSFGKAAEIATVQTAKDLDAPVIEITDIQTKDYSGYGYQKLNDNGVVESVDLRTINTATGQAQGTTGYDVTVHFTHSPASLGTPKAITLYSVRPYSDKYINATNYNGFKDFDNLFQALDELSDETEGILSDRTNLNSNSFPPHPPVNTKLYENGAINSFTIDSTTRGSEPTVFSFDPDSSTNTTVSNTNFLGEYKTDFRLAIKHASIDDQEVWQETLEYFYGPDAKDPQLAGPHKATSFIAEVEYANNKVFRSEIKYSGIPQSYTPRPFSGGACGITSGAPLVRTNDSSGDGYLKSSLTQNSITLLGMVGANGGPGRSPSGGNQQVVQDIGFYYSTTKPPTDNNPTFFSSATNDDLDTWATSASKASLTSSTTPTTLSQARTHATNPDPDQNDSAINGCYRDYAVTVPGLTPNTTYYYAAFCLPENVGRAGGYASLLDLTGGAYNARKWGIVKSFTTEGTGNIVDHPPTVTILDYGVDAGLNKVFLSGEAIAEGKNYKVNSVGFYLKKVSIIGASATESQILTGLANATSRITINATVGSGIYDDTFNTDTILPTPKADYYAAAFATFKINGGNVTSPVLSSNYEKINFASSVTPQSLLPNVENVKWSKNGKKGTFTGIVKANNSAITDAGFYIIGKEGSHMTQDLTIGGVTTTTQFAKPADGAALKAIFDSPPSGVITHKLSLHSSNITSPLNSFDLQFDNLKFKHTYYAAAYAVNSTGEKQAPTCLRVYENPPVGHFFGVNANTLTFDKNGKFLFSDSKVATNDTLYASTIAPTTLPKMGRWRISGYPSEWNDGSKRVPKATVTNWIFGGIPWKIHIDLKGIVNKGSQRHCFYKISEINDSNQNIGDAIQVKIVQLGPGNNNPRAPLYIPTSFTDNPSTY